MPAQENVDPQRSARKTGIKSSNTGSQQPLHAQSRSASRASMGPHAGEGGIEPAVEDEEDGMASLTSKSRYVVAELPVRLPVQRVPADKPNPKLGVGECVSHSKRMLTEESQGTHFSLCMRRQHFLEPRRCLYCYALRQHPNRHLCVGDQPAAAGGSAAAPPACAPDGVGPQCAAPGQLHGHRQAVPVDSRGRQRGAHPAAAVQLLSGGLAPRLLQLAALQPGFLLLCVLGMSESTTAREEAEAS